MSQLSEPPVRRMTKRWTKDEYNDAVERGLLRRQRVYLYRGELIQMPPMGALHVYGIRRLNYWLIETFRPDFEVQIQSPFECVDESEPEPDGAVYTKEQGARLPHPNAAVLVIEVSDSSIELNRQMAFDYAASGVPDYWIVDVQSHRIEVYRQIVADPSGSTGHRYAERMIYGIGQSVAPLAKPDVAVAVATLTQVS
jgi:Uma2 family endonuclease